MIGVNNLQRDLYILESHSPHNLYNSADNKSHEQWNSKLGNISDVSLHAISKNYPFISCKLKLASCDSCHNNVKHK